MWETVIPERWSHEKANDGIVARVEESCFDMQNDNGYNRLLQTVDSSGYRN